MKNEDAKQSIISQIEEIGYMNYLNLKKDVNLDSQAKDGLF